MKKLKQIKLERIGTEKFDTMGSVEMNTLKGGYTICGGYGTSDNPYVLQSYTVTPSSSGWDGCGDS